MQKYMDIYIINLDWIKLLSIIISIVTMFILVKFKRDHWLAQFCLINLLIYEIIRSSDYDKVADRIIHKILF